MYYGITADNGFGIYDDYKRASYNGSYLNKGKQIRKFDTLYKAFEWASESYNERQEDFDAVFYGKCSDVKMNWILYRNEIIKRNRQERI